MRQETVIEKRDVHPEAEAPPLEREQVAEEGEVDLIELARLFLREKKIILRFVAVSVVLTAAVVYLVMKPIYTAEALFLPPQNTPGSSVAQMAGQIGPLGALGALGGLKSPGELYVGILGSRTVADSLIKKFDLQKVYKSKTLSDSANRLKKRTVFTVGKTSSLVKISVEDHDPKRAADLANGYLDALYEQNGRLALTEASQRRLFFEEQLEREKNGLANAEVDMKKTQEQTGLIMPTGQAQVEIEEMAQIRAQISSREVELAAFRQGATDQNPQVVRLQMQITGLQQQLQKLQSDPSQRQAGNIQLPTAKVPEFELEYIRKQRELRYHETLFEMVAKQYEAARLDESRDAPLLQIIDRAVVPDHKSGLPRSLIVFAGGLLGGFIGIVWVILKYFAMNLMRDPANAAKLEELRQAASLER